MNNKEELPKYQQVFKRIIPDGKQEQLISCYKGGSFINNGGFGNCYSAKKVQGINHVGQEVIIKRMQKKKHNIDKLFMNEVNILNMLKATKSKYFINIYESWKDQENCYIVLEKGLLSLHDLVNVTVKQPFDSMEIVFFIREILRALLVLHRQRIMHRDIKPQNIVISNDYSIKLIDFGLSKLDLDSDPKDHKHCGTPNFMSPQLIMATDKSQYSYEVDIWATGVLLYFLMYKQYPYKCKKTQEVKIKIVDQIVPVMNQIQNKLSSENPQNRQLLKLLLKMLTYDKEKRPTAEQLLKDELINSIDSEREKIIKQSLQQKIKSYNKYKKADIKWNEQIIYPPIELQQNLLAILMFNDQRVIVLQVYHRAQYGHFLSLSNGSKFAYFNDETILRYRKNDNLNNIQDQNKKNILDKFVLNGQFKNPIQLGAEQTFIVKIVKTKEAIFVRLSNHSLQVFFIKKLPKNQRRQNDKINLQYVCGVYMNYNLLKPTEISIVNLVQNKKQTYSNFQQAKNSSTANSNKLTYIKKVMEVMLDNSQISLQPIYQRVQA